jgi:two-component system response regulator DegU
VTRVLVADGLRIFRAGALRLLEREADFEVAEASSLDELLVTAEAFKPDVVLIDLDLPPAGGVEGVRELSARSSATTIVWSFEAPDDVVVEALQAGADGYLSKEISADGLLRSLRSVMRGQAALPPELVSALVDALHRGADRTRALERSVDLSSREREVLHLIAAGAGNREIGERLAISEFTVKRHVQKILAKLDVSSRKEAARLHRAATGFEELPAAAG